MPADTTTFRLSRPAATSRSVVIVLGAVLLLGSAWPGGVAGVQPKSDGDGSVDTSSVQYLDAMAHAHDPNTFTPGGAVTIPYTPHAGDRTLVDGSPAVALPAGSATGAAMAASPQGSTWAAGETNPPTGGSDQQIAPAAAVLAGAGVLSPAATTNVLRREVYGFLPYWKLGYAVNYDVVSTIAYFGIDLNTDGTLDKQQNGTTTTGWAGWTSSAMTTVINAAHANHDRVALTVESFAWGSSGAAAQNALLTSPSAVTTAVQEIAGAVRDRGADGVNLDFEPIAPGMSPYYVAFVRALRAQLDSIHAGYELTFCGTGRPTTYDLPNLLAAGAADDVFIMGYDFRDGGASYAASLDPLTSPLVYDLNDAVNAYKAKVPVSKIILGLPWYGIAYSTPNKSLYAPNQSGTTYGQAAMVPYYTAADLAATNLKQYDSIEQSAWVSYYGTYGGTSPTWRELYYDDFQAEAARYDRINYWGLRGAGIWVLGYDSGHPELNQVIADKLLTDNNPPVAGIIDIAPVQVNETFTVSWTGRDDWNGVKSYDVQVAADGGKWSDWLVGTTATSSSFDGHTGHNYAFRVRATDGVGNIGPWDVSTAYTASPTFAVNGYATVTAGSVNERGQPTTSGGVIGTASAGTVFQIIGGPVSADGFTWYQVNGPVAELNPVTPTFPGAWIAVTDGTNVFVTPSTPPNTTAVSAGIGNLTIGTPGMPPSMTGIDAGRSFSPNGDGIRDKLALSWNDKYAYSDVTLSIYGLDGSQAGVVDLGAMGAGAQAYAWDGTKDGKTVVPDGQYILKLTATAGSTSYYAPSAGPFDATAWAGFGVIVDTTASGTYYPVAPVRILDTRNGTGLNGAFVAGKSYSFPVANHNGVPANAIAVTGNLTVTRATSRGYLILGPTTAVNSSTINFNANDDRANGVTIGLASNGSLSGKYVTGSGTGSVQVIFDLTGYFVRDPNGATFVPVVPQRIVDTRSRQGLGSALAHGTVYTFPVAGLAGVPAGATAVTGNATITGQTAGGYIALAPKIGSGQPTVSTLNFPYKDAKGNVDTRANNVVVPLNGGKLSVEYWGSPGKSVQFVFDVTGYFIPGPSGATFVPLSPSRVVDSRSNQGFSGPLRMTTTAGFTVRGQASVHLAAIAVVGNLTVTGQTSPGWLNGAPTAGSGTSTLNFPIGEDRANGFVSMLGPGGTLTVTYGGPGTTATTYFIVDVVGYYR